MFRFHSEKRRRERSNVSAEGQERKGKTDQEY